MHGEENLYTYTVEARRKTSLSIFTSTVCIYIYTYTPRKMYFFPVLLWLLSDILFENTNITRASVPSDHLSLRKVNAIYIYIYTHMEKCFRIYPYDIYIYSNLYPISRKIIFFSLENTNIFFLTRVSLLINLSRSRLAKTMVQ